ncbi:MAG: restriction endonuclease subunit S, partial [Anaerolineae bacterium]|nr:restriction endonuclease subunit S [Anaerolineae bacterium]
MRELPQGWAKCQLGDIVELKYGKSLPAKSRCSGEVEVYGSNGVIGVHNHPLTEGPTIVVGRKGSIGEIHFSPMPCFPIDTTYYVDEFYGQDLQFIRYLLETLGLTEMDRASAIPGLNREDAYALDVEIPPKSEQQRIVAKLDSLFARTRQGREELARIPALIEHYKQAILAAAFRGNLTADWRSAHDPDPIKADGLGIDSRTGRLPGIPDEWAWTSLDAVSEISGGLTKNAQRREIEQRVPYLRVANVYANELRLDDVKEIGCTDRELEKTQLEAGDLLVVEGNGSIEQIGRVAIWGGSISPCSHQNHLIRVRPNEKVISHYILFWMLSPLGRQYIERVASSSSGLHTLSISKVSGLALPLCTPDEMKEVVRHIEYAFSWLDTVLSESNQARYLLDHLDQATLAKAFRGELVPQDPNDEPASVLLDRIRAERANGVNPRRTHQKKHSTVG